MFGSRRYRTCMAQSILIFDFGTNEDAAQLARHKVEAWIQGARLGKKILLKFERESTDAAAASEDHSAEKSTEAAAKTEAKSGDGKSKAAGKSAVNKKAGAASKDDGESDAKFETAEASGRVRLFIRLGFSDHERLTLQRWLGRIATEEPFKSTRSETHRSGEPAFAQTADLFESLD